MKIIIKPKFNSYLSIFLLKLLRENWKKCLIFQLGHAWHRRHLFETQRIGNDVQTQT